ncbi:PP2C family protein-serine/threonine phosphatase [Streptomyces sp. NPDC090036]|uniref:PP2C family protein-serine/threonine phosphatase n=1 Tax=Streptomyces sp. NPDC090036 TaxID=3365926 RepID=UPI003820819D
MDRLRKPRRVQGRTGCDALRRAPAPGGPAQSPPRRQIPVREGVRRSPTRSAQRSRSRGSLRNASSRAGRHRAPPSCSFPGHAGRTVAPSARPDRRDPARRADTAQGDFTWINCGHPPPLLIRDGHVLQNALERPPHLPLGFGFHTPVPPAQEHVRLQPGDRVLMYSDGITEARSPEGDLFGEERLADTVIRSTASGDNAPEALRRLVNLLTHHQHHLRDDATILLIEWHPFPRTH